MMHKHNEANTNLHSVAKHNQNLLNKAWG